MSESGNHFHFMGICGTAMGSVAAAMKERGFTVTGSDAKTYEPMASFLSAAGIAVTEGYAASNIPPGADVIVIGNAISRGNPECEAVLNRKLPYTSLPELLKHHFLRSRRNFVVTGTHGKTTTSSLLAWMFECAGRRPSFMIGGITRNFGHGARFTDSPFVILEGDEYDTAFFDKRSKFVHYLPELVIVNNIEFDHADIFRNIDEIKLSFSRLFRIVPGNGLILLNGDDRHSLEAARESPAPVTTVGFSEECKLRISGVEPETAGTRFRLDGETFFVPLDGEFNVRNTAMAVAAGRWAGLTDEGIRDSLVGFAGVARRQQVRGITAGEVTIIDDFAHHPTAIRQTSESLRRRHVREGARLWAIFEPRSNTTRRKVFQQDLVAALGAADGALISTLPDPGKIPADDRLDVDRLVSDIRERHRIPCFLEPTADAIVSRLRPLVRPGDVVVVFSNGGFGGIHDKLLAM